MVSDQNDLQRLSIAVTRVHEDLGAECLRQCRGKSMSDLADIARSGGSGDIAS